MDIYLVLLLVEVLVSLIVLVSVFIMMMPDRRRRGAVPVPSPLCRAGYLTRIWSPAISSIKQFFSR